MEIRITGKNIEVTEPLRGYAEEKIARLTRFFDQIGEVDIELMREKNPSIAAGATVEATLYTTRGPLIRAKESSADMFASIDLVSDKLERQIKRYKNKLYSSSNRNHSRPAGTPLEREEEEKDIVRVKQVDMKPMTPEEAAMQMDLLGHDFFVFTNADTERVNVVYRRRDNNYGLIEPV